MKAVRCGCTAPRTCGSRPLFTYIGGSVGESAKRLPSRLCRRFGCETTWGRLLSATHCTCTLTARWRRTVLTHRGLDSDIRPLPADDIFVDKHRVSGFWDTPLDSIREAAKAPACAWYRPV